MNSFYALLTVLFSSIAVLPTLAQENAPPVSAAVFNLVDGDAKVAGTGANAAELINAFLSAEEGIMLVERQQLETILAEQELTLSGTIDPATAANIGRLTGAKVLITGRAFGVGESTYLVAKVISSETGRVFGQTVQFRDEEELGTAAEELSGKIGAAIRDNREALVPAVETPDERLARLQKLIPEGAELPSVYVSIPEEHLTQAVPDPAAQTEIYLTLESLGFPITDTLESADILITGEAFSERAGARGNLISCRARVEIEGKKDGDLFFADRQTSVAIDLAENVAAKSALQEAGAKLAERIAARIAAE